ncbi:hypothetical protein [Bradyrhizobium sp. Bra64]|uniref:hypothetical protein n=1 Tax=Bradyrhizobium sp. Bra64 TaxID=2926009 RepID=UPI002119AA16|nr:hypothetical protein [Bradyrhizobium sp. Bra64]
MSSQAIPPVPWEAVLKVAQHIPANQQGVPANTGRLEAALNSIKRSVATRAIDFDHLHQRDLWQSAIDEIDSLTRTLTRAASQPLHGVIFGAEGLSENLARLKVVEEWATLRFRFFDDLSKSRRAGRSPSREYAYKTLIEMWAEYGNVPSSGKDGPFFRFFNAACEAVGVKAPDGDNMRNIVSRYRVG